MNRPTDRRMPRQVMLPDGRSVPMTDAFRAEISEKYSSMAVRPLRCLALAVKVGGWGDLGFGCHPFFDSRLLFVAGFVFCFVFCCGFVFAAVLMFRCLLQDFFLSSN